MAEGIDRLVVGGTALERFVRDKDEEGNMDAYDGGGGDVKAGEGDGGGEGDGEGEGGGDGDGERSITGSGGEWAWYCRQY